MQRYVSDKTLDLNETDTAELWRRVEALISENSDLKLRALAWSSRITGELAEAGSMVVGGELTTGVFVQCTEEELRDAKMLPLYRRVAIVLCEDAI